MASLRDELIALYDRDYALWLEGTIERLRDRDYSQVDWEHLLDELETMGRSDKRAIKNNLVILLVHLLKWQFQPDARSGSWAGSITEHRTRIQGLLEDSPSLNKFLDEALIWAYPRARRQASDETGIALGSFPDSCPYELDLVLGDDFLPQASMTNE
ncbi:MAG: DUF29 domain-containing protein [Cyanobacteria bacterium]|nr:DUF29 domain-containing protein [Cyanobacteriota bacterium]